jgi:hypothetical protein
MEQVNLPVEIDALSVYRALEHIEDGRHKGGVRYSVALIFTLILLAKGAGMTTPLAIAQWVRLRAGWLREVLPITCTSFPCAATVSQCIASRGCRAGQRGADAGIDARDGNPRLWRRTQPPGRTSRAGETCAGGPGWQDAARHGCRHEPADQQQMHQLALYETHTGLILKEQVTGEKQNELSIMSQFLTPLLVKGRIISADARPTQHAFCRGVTRWDGDYVLIAKGNQSILHDDLQLFAERAACRLPGLAHRADRQQRPWAPGNPRTRREYRTQ